MNASSRRRVILLLVVLVGLFAVGKATGFADSFRVGELRSLVAEPSFDVSQIETQMQVIKSRAIAISVIDQLNLAGDLSRSSSSPLASFVQRVRGWFGGPPAGERASASAQPADDIVGVFLDRLSVARVNLSNVIELSFNWNEAARAAECQARCSR